jgi:hypothetical protein
LKTLRIYFFCQWTQSFGSASTGRSSLTQLQNDVKWHTHQERTFLQTTWIYWHKEMAYLLTPWSRVLPEKLKRPELLKKVPAFYGTRRFITVFTRARHLSLSWARLIQSMPPIQPLAGPF